MPFEEELSKVAGKLFINGNYVDSIGGQLFQTFNPATEEPIGKAVAGTPQDIDLAVTSARKAFTSPEWRDLDPHSRGRLLYKLADLIDQHTELLAHYETLNAGKPITTSRGEDIPFTAYIYRYYAGQTDKIKGSTLAVSKPFLGYTKKQPIGVVGLIIPWNYPLLMMAWKVAPALAAGCTVVLKPAEQTPLSALLLGQLFNQAGFPPGVINIVTGFGETGQALTQHKLVNKISFTGSTQVGYLIARNSHKQNIKPITLELGGKSANIILHDADLQLAIDQACSVIKGNCGQSCIAGSRTYVHESIYDKFAEGVAKFANSVVVGDPFDVNTQQGTIANKDQFEKVLHYIEEGKREGATILAGGNRIGNKGYYIQPTVFINVTDNMRIAREEIFGPVMSLLKWSDEQDVIQRANALPYGLGAGVVTRSIDKALKFAERLHAGTVYVNCYDYQEGSTPFGGFKDSGIGKDLGDEGLQGYLLTKTVLIRPNY